MVRVFFVSFVSGIVFAVRRRGVSYTETCKVWTEEEEARLAIINGKRTKKKGKKTRGTPSTAVGRVAMHMAVPRGEFEVSLLQYIAVGAGFAQI